MSNSTLAILGIVTASLMLVAQMFATSPTTENQTGGRRTRATKRRHASHNKSRRK